MLKELWIEKYNEKLVDIMKEKNIDDEEIARKILEERLDKDSNYITIF